MSNSRVHRTAWMALLLSLYSAAGLRAQTAQDKLWDASRAGDTVAIGAALGVGAKVDAMDTRQARNGRYPLNWAALGNHAETIKYLVAHGAKVDAANITGFTPLHHAAESGSLQAAQVLLDLGADPATRNGAGETALDVATRVGSAEVAKLLASAGKKAN